MQNLALDYSINDHISFVKDIEKDVECSQILVWLLNNEKITTSDIESIIQDIKNTKCPHFLQPDEPQNKYLYDEGAQKTITTMLNPYGLTCIKCGASFRCEKCWRHKIREYENQSFHYNMRAHSKTCSECNKTIIILKCRSCNRSNCYCGCPCGCCC